MLNKILSLLGVAGLVALAISLMSMPVFAASLTSVTNTPASAIAGATTSHTVVFTTNQTLPVDGRVRIDFPAGFNVTGAVLGPVTGPDGGFSLSVVERRVFVIRDGIGSQFSPGAVTIVTNNITNSLTAATDYKVTVTTQNSTGVPIDGPTDSANFTISPGAIDHYSVSNITSPQVVGKPFNVFIQAQDSSNNSITDGPQAAENISISFGAIDVGATWTGNLTASGNATVSMNMSLANTSQNITFTGVTSNKTGTSNTFKVNAAIDHYSVSNITSPQVVGMPFNVFIQAQDSSNNSITDGPQAAENISISFGAIDVGATWTGNLTASGNATVSMNMSLAKTSQNITFTGVTSGKTGTSNIFKVNPAIDHYSVSSVTSPQVVGKPFNVFIQAQDSSNNSITDGPQAAENISISFGAIDVGATWTGNLTASGNATVSMNMSLANTSQNITFTGVTSNKTGTSNTFKVNPAIDHYSISSISSPQVMGTPFGVTIQAQDSSNNSITDGPQASENITISFVKADARATPTSNVTANGTATVNMTMTVAQDGQAIIFTGVTSNKTGTSGNFTVNPGVIDHYSVSSIGSPQAVGARFGVTIQAQDSFSNNITIGANATENINITFGLADTGATPISAVTAGGSASVNMTMTVAQGGQTIIFTGATSGKTGTSNIFNVGTTLGSVTGGGGAATGPVISSIAVTNIGKTSASITWTTDTLSTSQVAYSASGSNIFSPEDLTLVVYHQVNLAGLTPNTTYQYIIRCVDSTGNVAVSDQYNFTTLGTSATFVTSDLSIAPSSVSVRESANISVTVTNTGDVTGDYEVALNIDGVQEATKTVTLNAGASQKVTFTTAKGVVGNYAISIDNLSGTLTVKAASTPTSVPPTSTPPPTPPTTATPGASSPAPPVTPPAVAPPLPPKAGGSSRGLIIGLIAGCIVIAILIALIVRRQRQYG